MSVRCRSASGEREIKPSINESSQAGLEAARGNEELAKLPWGKPPERGGRCGATATREPRVRARGEAERESCRGRRRAGQAEHREE